MYSAMPRALREIAGPGAKISFGPLVNGAPKSHDEQKKRS